MPLKIVHFYSQGKAGWTETYYTQDSTWGTFRARITRDGLEKFAGIRNPSTLFEAVRMTELTGLRNTNLYIISPAIPGNPHGPDGAAHSSAPDPVTTDSLCVLYGQGGKSRRIAIRGLRDEDVVRTQTGQDVPGPNWNNDFGFMVQQAVNWGYSIRYGAYPKPPGAPWDRVVSILPTVGATGFVTVTLAGLGPFAYNAGDQVHFRGIPVRGLPLFGQNHTVTLSAAPNAFTIAYGIVSAFPAVLANTFVTHASYGMDPISYGVFERWSERKTGRPTFAPRGRRRAISSFR